MHSCTGPGCSVCADSMAGEDYAQALEDEERALEAVLKLPEEYRS